MITILVVEDNFQILNGIKDTLGKLKQHVNIITTTSGSEALEIALREVISIFIIDIRLPDWDGLELSQELRKDYPLAPIIIESSITDYEYQSQVHDKIANLAYLMKPFSEEKLTKKVMNALELIKVTGTKSTILKTGGTSWIYTVDDIIFIERIKNKKWISVVAFDSKTGNEYSKDFFGITLKGVLDQINNSKQFCMCHKSFIVNKKLIKGIDARNKVIHLKYTEKVVLYSNTYKNNLFTNGEIINGLNT